MFILGEFFISLKFLVDAIGQILYWLLVARIVIGWLPVDPYSTIVQFLIQATEPLLAPFRRIPLRIGVLDLTPLLAFFVLFLINRILDSILIKLAIQFKAGG